MINKNKLYSGFFSIVLIYTIMTIFEIVFYAADVGPVISNDMHHLMDSYKSKDPIKINFDPNPLNIAILLNKREYLLINNFNLNSYFVVIILIFLLTSLLFYLYAKIGVIENNDNTEEISPDVSLFLSNSRESRSRSSSELLELANIQTNTQNNTQTNTQNNTQANIQRATTSHNRVSTTRRSIKFIYLKHAVRCAISTIVCLIIYQIFFYNYGLAFKYVGSTDELIVTLIEHISS